MSVFLTLGTAAPGARAQQSDAATTARELFEQAEHAYGAEEYAQAVNLLRRAYALAPRPAFLFNIAQAQRKLGQCDAARASYQDYLLRETNPIHRQRVERILRDMPSCDAQTPVPPAPAPSPPTPSRTEVSAPAAAPAPRPAELTRTPLPPADAGPAPGAEIAKWSLLGTGTVSAGLAVYFALDARAASNDLENATSWRSDSSDREARGERSTLLAWVCGAAGVTLLGARLTLHLLNEPGRAPNASALQLAPLPGGARASFARSF